MAKFKKRKFYTDGNKQTIAAPVTIAEAVIVKSKSENTEEVTLKDKIKEFEDKNIELSNKDTELDNKDTALTEDIRQITQNETKIANSDGGTSAGTGSSATGGGAVGNGATAGNGFAGGQLAKAVNSDGNGIDAIQLGQGTNSTEKTLQVYGDNIYNAITHTFTMLKSTILKWEKKNNANPYIGYCTDSYDGTFVIASKEGTTYKTGLAIGDTSGNLLWKGNKILTANEIYPVGSIYMSTYRTSPASIFGGTWELIKDRFLLGAGGTYKLGLTGGEPFHTLTIDEMPSHRHSSDSYMNGYPSNVLDKEVYATWVNRGQPNNNNPDTGQDGSVRTSYVGGGQPHNNMPPYLAVNIWKRTA